MYNKKNICVSARKEVEKLLVFFDTCFICGKSPESFFPHLSANGKLSRHTTNENPVGGENSSE